MRTGAGIVLAHLRARPRGHLSRQPANLQSPCNSAGTTRWAVRLLKSELARRWHSGAIAAGDLAESLHRAGTARIRHHRRIGAVGWVPRNCSALAAVADRRERRTSELAKSLHATLGLVWAPPSGLTSASPANRWAVEPAGEWHGPPGMLTSAQSTASS